LFDADFVSVVWLKYFLCSFAEFSSGFESPILRYQVLLLVPEFIFLLNFGPALLHNVIPLCYERAPLFCFYLKLRVCVCVCFASFKEKRMNNRKFSLKKKHLKI
jgi:hypothetical protein